ncbi:MAG: adenosylhomocysteinase [Alphaproteobacteria bacterium]
MDSTSLYLAGTKKIDWARANCPLLGRIAAGFRETKPFAGLTIGVSLHIEKKTAVLFQTLQAGGAHVVATGNLGTTQDDVALALNTLGIKVYGKRDDTPHEHLDNVREVLRHKPDLLLDNGADLTALAVGEPEFPLDSIRGGTEETTSGGHRMREDLAGRIPFPVIVINDSPLKLIVENKHGVGQGAVESFYRITNLMIQGKQVAVLGYGWVGRGIAKYFRDFGAHVQVVEPDPIRALEAAVDGFRVATIDAAVGRASVILTATGRPNVIAAAHFPRMRDGVVLGNTGHFDHEIDTGALREQATAREVLEPGIERFRLENGRHVTLLCGGRMYNLGGVEAKGNPIEVMDMGFALQARSLEALATGSTGLIPGPQSPPRTIDESLARAMVEVMMA